MEKETLERMDKLVKKLSKIKSVRAIYLFGSHATGKATDDSDVDIAVLTKNSSEEEEFKIKGLWDEIFDVHVFWQLPLLIQFRVIKEGKLIFIKDREYVKETWIKVVREYFDFQPRVNRFYQGVLENV